MTTKPRFIIADQALQSVTGHYFEYDIAVAANVPPTYDVLIIANSEARGEVLRHATPFFQCDFWRPTAMRRPTANGSGWQTVAGVIAWQRSQVRRSMRQAAQRAQILPLLQSLRRLATIAEPAGRPADYEVGQLWAGERDLKNIFLADLVELFERYALTAQDVLFFPNMNHWSVAAVAELSLQISPARSPIMKLLFRRNFDFIPNGLVSSPDAAYWAGVLRKSFDLLADRITAGQVDLYTDTTRLQNEYALVSPIALTVLPIPFRHDYIEVKSAVPQVFHITYLGEARLEKGFGHLPALVEQFKAERENGRVKFVFQAVPAPEPAVLAAIRKLKSQVGVTLLEKPLPDQEYYALLNSSHVILMLYDPRQYYSRSSCIFVESVISATPCITLAGSWMASVMEPGTGRIVENVTQIPAALRQILDRYADYQQAIARAGQRWRSFHNPRHLVELLLKDSPAQPERARTLTGET